jgi:group I intron endonuclease
MGDRTSPIHRLYIISNTVNEKKYVGQSSEHFLSHRWGGHKARAKQGSDTHLYRAMRKYGVENFFIEEIARCHTKTELLRLEKFWIGLLKANIKEFGYNQTFGGEAPKHTEETKQKISEVQKGRVFSEARKQQQREILSNPETVQKRIDALKAWWVEAKKTKNHPFLRGDKKNITPEGREAMAAATRRRWKKWRESKEQK